MEANLQKNEITTNINMPGLSKEAEGFLCKIIAPALTAGSDLLATKFRMAQFNMICEFANKYAGKARIELNPTPPKFLIPFIEKASLEDDEYLQKEWAKLLVAASKDYNPIHLQYKDILSKIGSEEAKLLKEVYQKQNKSLFIGRNLLKEYNEKSFEFRIATELTIELNKADSMMNTHSSKTTNRVNPVFDFPCPFTKEVDDLEFRTITNFFRKSLILLEQQNLIGFFIEDKKPMRLTPKIKVNVFLTNFGYEFIASLEDVENPI